MSGWLHENCDSFGNYGVRMSSWLMRIVIYLGFSYEDEHWIKLYSCLNCVYGCKQVCGVYMCESMYTNGCVCMSMGVCMYEHEYVSEHVCI